MRGWLRTDGNTSASPNPPITIPLLTGDNSSFCNIFFAYKIALFTILRPYNSKYILAIALIAFPWRRVIVFISLAEINTPCLSG
jgi:hypothetical protein